MQTLTFEITVNAPRAQVWAEMLSDEGYRAWTSAFAEGSHFRGAWDEGSKILFLAPSGDGMTAEIAENRLHEFVSIRHLGLVENGLEDTTSDKARAWAPAYENFRFEDVPGGCHLTVTLDTAAGYEQYMQDTYPKALALLKQRCER